MIEAQFNMFDAAVVLVMFLSTLLAFFRGFVREFLSLGAWVGAGLITVYSFDNVVEMLKPHVSKDMIAYLIGGVGTYIVALISISIINMVIIRYVKSGEEVGMFDNFLGMVFGALRGGFIISLGYLVLSLVIDNENPPAWVTEALTKDYAQDGAIILANIAPGYLEDISSLGETLEALKETPEASPDQIDLLNSGENSLLIDKDKGYSDNERNLLEQIMKSRQ
jgi:membrane protein required for colicin V production